MFAAALFGSEARRRLINASAFLLSPDASAVCILSSSTSILSASRSKSASPAAFASSVRPAERRSDARRISISVFSLSASGRFSNDASAPAVSFAERSACSSLTNTTSAGTVGVSCTVSIGSSLCTAGGSSAADGEDGSFASALSALLSVPPVCIPASSDDFSNGCSGLSAGRASAVCAEEGSVSVLLCTPSVLCPLFGILAHDMNDMTSTAANTPLIGRLRDFFIVCSSLFPCSYNT